MSSDGDSLLSQLLAKPAVPVAEQEEADAWYAAELERLKDLAPA